MSEWPTASTMVWLAVGVGCLLWTMLVFARRGVAGGLSLAVLFVWTTFVGYHLTPWLALENGVWESSLLVSGYIDAGLMSSSLSMLAFIAGYSVKINLLNKAVPGQSQHASLRVPIVFVFVFILLVSILFIVNVRGFSNIFFASYGRGWGQFDYSFEGRLYKIVYIILLVFSIILTFSSSICILDRRSSLFSRIFIGWIGLFVASLPLIHKFSRGAGLALLLFFVLACYLRGFRGAIKYALVGVLGLYFCFVGYDARSEFQPGLANFALAAVSRGDDPGSFRANVRPAEADATLSPGKDNFFNALDAWTLSARTASVYAGSLWDRVTTFLSVLQPLPSLFTPLRSQAGPDLAAVVGVSGKYGITTPALAELNYLFSAYSFVFYIFYGLLCGWIDKRYTQCPTFGLLATKLLIAAGFVLALHSGLRASTRFVLYAVVLFLFVPWAARQMGGGGRKASAPVFRAP